MAMEVTGIFKDITQDKSRLRLKGEVTELIGCSKKLQKFTGWSPETELRSGLQELLKWMQENPIDNFGYQL